MFFVFGEAGAFPAPAGMRIPGSSAPLLGGSPRSPSGDDERGASCYTRTSAQDLRTTWPAPQGAAKLFVNPSRPTPQVLSQAVSPQGHGRDQALPRHSELKRYDAQAGRSRTPALKKRNVVETIGGGGSEKLGGRALRDDPDPIGKGQAAVPDVRV